MTTCPEGFDPVAGLDPHSPPALRRAWAHHAGSCPVCSATARDHAVGSALLGPPALPTAEPAPRRFGGLALAAAAGLALGLMPSLGAPPTGPTRQARGASAAAVSLEGVVSRGETPISPASARPGDVVRLSVAARPEARVWVWVRAPDGLHSVGSVSATDAPTWLGDGATARGWQLDMPGPHVFFASAAGDGECGPEGCPRWEVEAR